MATDEKRNEVEELRAQLAELREKQKQQSQDRVTPNATAAQADTQETDPDASPSLGEDLANQFRTLLDSFEADIKEANPLTVLVIFLFGFLFGRLLPR
jgi:uncharacterized membrane protein YdfJ with MMPL/SSD domain